MAHISKPQPSLRVLKRVRDFAVQRGQPLPDGRGSVAVVLIQRELQSRDR